ncbi:unnamed protein product [Prunus armeniaca]
MQDNTAAVEEENPSFSAKKLLNHWLRFSSGLPETNITLNSEFERILLDYSWQRATPETLEIGRGGVGPFAASLKEKINRMFGGEHVRFKFIFLRHIYEASSDPTFCNRNTWRATRVILKDVIAVGISGSFLGPLQTDPKAIETARGRQLHLGWMILVEGCSNNSFYPVCNLENVDPIDVARNITGLNPETTLVLGKVKSISLSSYPKGPPPTPSPAPSPEPTISPYPASPVHSPAPSPDSNHLPPAPSKVPPHPRPCPYRGSGIPPSSSPTSHPNPTVPPSYAPNGSPYSPSASPYTSPSSQFLQLSVRKVERCVCLYI